MWGSAYHLRPLSCARSSSTNHCNHCRLHLLVGASSTYHWPTWCPTFSSSTYHAQVAVLGSNSTLPGTLLLQFKLHHAKSCLQKNRMVYAFIHSGSLSMSTITAASKRLGPSLVRMTDLCCLPHENVRSAIDSADGALNATMAAFATFGVR